LRESYGVVSLQSLPNCFPLYGLLLQSSTSREVGEVSFNKFKEPLAEKFSMCGVCEDELESLLKCRILGPILEILIE
jgi:hypothetical protein